MLVFIPKSWLGTRPPMTGPQILAIMEGVSDRVWYAVGAGIMFLILLALALSLRARSKRRHQEEGSYAWGEPSAVPEQPPEAVQQDAEMAAFPDQLPDPASAPVGEEAWVAEQPAAAEQAPLPTAPAAPASGEVHYCRCPSCQTQFSVNGPKPIVTNCPGCGKKGYLR